MPKITKSFRISKDDLEKVELAAKQKNMSLADFINHALVDQSDRVLMGRNTDINTEILHDIWERICYVQADRKLTLVGLQKETPEEQDSACQNFTKQVQEKIYER